MKHLALLVIAASLLSPSRAAFGFEFSGKTLPQAIAELEARGLSILYSSDLVKPHMRVREPPGGAAPRVLLEEIVRPHGIVAVEGPGGILILTRARPPAASASPPAPVRDAQTLEQVIVNASRYAWVRIPQVSLTRLSDAELRLAPNVGDDPLRTLARLPGAVGSDLSAKLNVRGGATDEVLVRFDGLRLMNPFHLKDFQSVFSAIDPAAVGAVDVYTGGFPAGFGDRMSGVIDIHPVRGAGAAQREIAVSLFNTSAAAVGRLNRGRGDWAVAARRGNLDRVLEWSGMHLGEPAYSDVYAHLGHALNEAMGVSVNALQFDDDIRLADSDVEEQAQARYRDRYLWLRLDAHPREALWGAVIVARTDLQSSRSGEAVQPGIADGALSDERAFDVDSLQTDWNWRVFPAGLMQFGGEWRRSDGRYRYRDEAQFDLQFDVPGATGRESGVRAVDTRAAGEQYGVYAALRAEIAPPLTLEGGVRWDRSTLGEAEEYVSPRASALFRISERTLLRASGGRFVQTQSVDELPASDGVTAFAPAQRAAHWLLSVEQRLGDSVDLRVEAYRKRYSRLRPRYENLMNEIVILPELKPDRVLIEPMRARADGVEVSLRSVDARPRFWGASYAWSRAEDVLDSGDVRRSWDQRHALSVTVGWESDAWELSFASTWRSGWPTTAIALDAAGEAVVSATAMNRDRLRTYIDIDARVARKFRLSGGASLLAFFELRNAANRNNECCIEYELDDESEEPTLVLERIHSLPLLPSLGFIWRF